MPGLFEIANEIAVMFGGRNPQWVTQATGVSAAMSAPSAATDGKPLNDAVVTLLSVELDTATSVDFTIWFYTNKKWWAAEGGSYSGKTADWLGRYETGGYERVYVQITGTNGTVNLHAGPCALE